jgi:hypothetical protein
VPLPVKAESPTVSCLGCGDSIKDPAFFACGACGGGTHLRCTRGQSECRAPDCDGRLELITGFTRVGMAFFSLFVLTGVVCVVGLFVLKQLNEARTDSSVFEEPYRTYALNGVAMFLSLGLFSFVVEVAARKLGYEPTLHINTSTLRPVASAK